MTSPLTLRVAARFQIAESAREEARDSTQPVNKPKDLSREVVEDYGSTDEREDTVKPDKDDVRPKDVFKPLPSQVSVYNYVTKGWPGDADDYTDMEKVLDKQVPKDKGYDTVSNLSQYLIETEGGGGTPPVEGND